MMNEKNGLAEAALDYFMMFLGPNENIDLDYQCKILESFGGYSQEMSGSDQAALKMAAAMRLAYIRSGPDEYGYNPGLHFAKETADFLEAIATGEIFDQWG